MKILFVMPNMNIGGATTSLLNLINLLKSHKKECGFEIDLLLLKKHGEVLQELKDINIIEADYCLQSFGVSQKDSKNYGKWFYIKRTIDATIVRIFGNKWLLNSKIKKHRNIDKEYDIVISFFPSVYKTTNTACPELGLQKVKAKKKFVFIHNDFNHINLNNKYSLDILSKFDKIILVSKSCADGMIKRVPYLKNKITYLYNVCNSKEVVNKSKLYKVEYDKKIFNLVTVARLNSEKGVFRVLPIVKRLINEDVTDFCWHIIGDGLEREQIENYIQENNLKQNIKLYGSKTNPYPYIKEADLFLLPSYHESFGIVIIEAFSLSVPVLSTHTISANEIVGEYGFVCENNEESIYLQLKELIKHKDLVEKKKHLLKNYEFNNDQIIKRFLKLIK